MMPLKILSLAQRGCQSAITLRIARNPLHRLLSRKIHNNNDQLSGFFLLETDAVKGKLMNCFDTTSNRPSQAATWGATVFDQTPNRLIAACTWSPISSRGFILRGFTLIEMLIAMTVTLLLMAALGKGFAFVGESIRDSRTQVELTNDLRDVSNRLQDELSRCTVPIRPVMADERSAGYFMYYEGPLTDATSSLFRAVAGAVPTPDSRYGDLDDYLAFTAVASGDNWFTGKVPRFVLDQKTAQVDGVTYNPTNFPGSPFDPVVIRSKYAEIVYFASPEYSPASLPQNPAYIDVDGDTNLGSGDTIENGLPDNIRIHRRVLLIRPDLNLNNNQINSQVYSGSDPVTDPTVRYMLADQWPPTDATLGETITSQASTADAWLYGMAGVHQQCDLSLRRVLDGNGRPTRNVAANSLEDLSKPHNRFAHVRVPGTLVGLANDNITSMPVLALTRSATILDAVSLADSSVRVAPPIGAVASGSTAAVITPRALSGFIRPEFVLGQDRNHPSHPDHAWGAQRLGEDVLVTKVVAFDIKIFDQFAPVITTSQRQVIQPHASGFREAFRDAINGSSLEIRTGEYVDLMFPVLAGGAMRGFQPRLWDRSPTGTSDVAIVLNNSTRSRLVTEFSGLAPTIGAVTVTSANAYSTALYRSGKILVDNTGHIRVFQPTFDTFTYHYERDGFLQNSVTGSGNGTQWHLGVPGSSVTFDQAGNGLDTRDSLLLRETLPPFLATPRSIEVSIRLENPLNRQVRQISVIHND